MRSSVVIRIREFWSGSNACGSHPDLERRPANRQGACVFHSRTGSSPSASISRLRWVMLGGPMATKNHDTTPDSTRRPGRRQMLQMSVGGLTLASGLFGGMLTPRQAAGADGSITPQNGNLRRVVSGLNPDG